MSINRPESADTDPGILKINGEQEDGLDDEDVPLKD